MHGYKWRWKIKMNSEIKIWWKSGKKLGILKRVEQGKGIWAKRSKITPDKLEDEVKKEKKIICEG